MAQVITRCRLTGHYMFMGMDVDPKEFTRSPGPFARKFCPFCACDHLWHKEDSKFLAPKVVLRPQFNKRADHSWVVPPETKCEPSRGISSRP